MSIKINGLKTHSIYICDRVQLYVNNKGFLFTTKRSPRNLETFQDWSQWKWHWRLYERDGIRDIIKIFLSGRHTDKCEDYYQQLNFQA